MATCYLFLTSYFWFIVRSNRLLYLPTIIIFSEYPDLYLSYSPFVLFNVDSTYFCQEYLTITNCQPIYCLNINVNLLVGRSKFKCAFVRVFHAWAIRIIFYTSKQRKKCNISCMQGALY